MKQHGRRKIFSVREIVNAIWRRFEDVPARWIEGEITNLSRSRSGQVFFSLVDTDHQDPTQIECSMNAVVFDRLTTTPADGALVQAYGRVEFWRRQSRISVRVERLEPSGEGLLLARIAELRRRLEAEGLTDPARKRPIPFLPRRIGLITARDGAAKADFITNTLRRFPGVQIVVVHSLVQGEAAPGEIVRALRHLDADPQIDVIVLARGGGAIEDLMAFNSEALCRAIAACGTPVVSAVGHETDTPLCDLVADLRASTPTKAAEFVVPDAADLTSRLSRHERQMATALARHQVHAADAVGDRARRLTAALRTVGTVADHRVSVAGRRLSPALLRVHANAAERATRHAERMRRAVGDHVTGADTRLERAAALLGLLSPERTVARGYAIVRAHDGMVVGGLAQLAVNDHLTLQLRDGDAAVRVTGTTAKEPQ